MNLTVNILDHEIEQHTRLVRGMAAALFPRNDTEPDATVLQELSQAKATLRSLQQRRDSQKAEAEKGQAEVVDLDKKVESHDPYSLVLLARNSSFNSVVDPETGRPRDLTNYYAAWVTPHVEAVQALVRRAAERVPGRRIWGYQGRSDLEATGTQVKALFDTLKEAGIAYIASVVDFGAGPGQVTQRTRLPRESVRNARPTASTAPMSLYLGVLTDSIGKTSRRQRRRGGNASASQFGVAARPPRRTGGA